MFRELSEEEEEEFRQAAHRDYNPGDNISELWHPIYREECKAINRALKNAFDQYPELYQ